jgi:hypothetical protein
MGGCTNCKAKTGCDDRKGAMLADVQHALDHLYPSRTWGEPDDAAGLGEPMTPEELTALADELASELHAATFVRPGDDDEPCDYLYVLCMGRAPCAVQVRDEGVPVPAEWRELERVEELYLRVVISHRARIAAVQQVAITVERSGGAFVIREAPRAGVYDAPLLPRMQKLVAILPAYDLLHVDFGEIAHPPEGFHAGSWPQLYQAAAPAIANYLFYPQPTTMVATSLIA